MNHSQQLNFPFGGSEGFEQQQEQQHKKRKGWLNPTFCETLSTISVPILRGFWTTFVPRISRFP